jgi:hypothetical protein
MAFFGMVFHIKCVFFASFFTYFGQKRKVINNKKPSIAGLFTQKM